MIEYTEQAEKFLADTDTTFSIVHLYTGPHFDDDKEKRDVYQLTLTNKRGIYSAKFGDSISNTLDRLLAKESTPFGCRLIPNQALYKHTYTKNPVTFYKWCIKNHKRLRALPKTPTAYDVLACLTKYDPGTFANFCSEFGYDTDSKKAEKVYFAVQEEWAGVRKLFTPEQMEQLQEIQ